MINKSKKFVIFDQRVANIKISHLIKILSANYGIKGFIMY